MQRTLALVLSLAVVGCQSFQQPTSAGVLPSSALTAYASHSDTHAPPSAFHDVGANAEPLPAPQTHWNSDVFGASQLDWWTDDNTSDIRMVNWLDETQHALPDVFENQHFGEEHFLQQNSSSNLITDGAIRRLPPINQQHTPISFTDLVGEQMAGIYNDHRGFYSRESLTWLTFAVAIGAGMANTGFDEHFIRDSYVDSIILAPSDELYEGLHLPKFFGEGQYTIPAFVLLALSEPLIEDLPMGSAAAEWGQRSFRTVLVGAPPLLFLQSATGGARPGESSVKSHWQPFQNSHGVSGHSFMGAIPFMSAAKMVENKWLKASLYAASTLPALSRVNDDDHYFSQAFMGWCLAYISATAVDHSHQQNDSFQFVVYPQQGGVGVGLEIIQ
ncbi:MAG: hypothetical protein ACI9G1_000466 [Pirellulaceae bacterium]|jgi:hypothetical protein